MFVLALMAHPFKRANQEIYYCSKNVYYLGPFFWSNKSDSNAEWEVEFFFLMHLVSNYYKTRCF